MRVRRLSELKRTQAQMLVDMRAGQAVGALTADVDEPVAGSGLALGRVEAVVASDEALGAHLVVAKLKLDRGESGPGIIKVRITFPGICQ